jgi:hypothetical protein
MEPFETKISNYVKDDRGRLRTSRGLKRVGGAKHSAAGLDGIETLPDHAHDGARGHVLDQSGEELLSFEILVVCGAIVNQHCSSSTLTTHASRDAPQ